jgi:hypothetical protein
MSIRIRVGGTWRNLALNGLRLRVGGTWRNASSASVKVNGTWRNIFTEATVPLAPTITSISAGNGQLSVNFTAGGNGGSAITNYQFSTNNGSTWTTRSPAATTSPILITGLSNGVTYTVRIRAVNAVGAGAQSNAVNGTPVAPPPPPPPPPVYNNATGGTTQSVSNYNGTGQTWRTHTFTANGTFSVSTSVAPFSAVVVAAGGGGGNNYHGNAWTGAGGGAGGVLSSTSLSVPTGNHTITVGAGAGAFASGGNSAFASFISTTGGGRGGISCPALPQSGGSGGAAGVDPACPQIGTGIAGQGNNGGGANAPSWAGGGGGANSAGSPGGIHPGAGGGGTPRSLNISGAVVDYGRGGNSTGRNTGTHGTGNGGGGGYPSGAGGGGNGIVVIAYRIG